MTNESSPQQVDFQFRPGLLLAAGVIVAAFFFIGLGLFAAWHFATPKVFESSATVLIEPRSIQAGSLPPDPKFNLRHDRLICEDNIVIKALVTYDLKDLPTLRDLSRNEQVNLIQSNFDAYQPEETDLYELCFRSPNPRDAQTVLATLASTYEKHLTEKYRSAGTDTRELLLKMESRFADGLLAKTEKVEELKTQIAAGQTGEKNQAKLKELQNEVKVLQSKLDIASQHLLETPQEKPMGFNFQTLSPAVRGIAITPRRNILLLVGGGIGAMFGLIVAGLMIAVLKNRN